MLTWAHQILISGTPSVQRLLRGLPGYLILFATHAFAPQRQYLSRELPSPSVFLLISTNFTSTPGIPLSSPVLKSCCFKCTSRVEPRAFTSETRPPTRPLRPIIPNNACTPRVTAAAGTELAGASSTGTVNNNTYWMMLISSLSTGLTTQRPSSLTRRCCVRVTPIAQNSSLLPPVGVWTVCQFQCG